MNAFIEATTITFSGHRSSHVHATPPHTHKVHLFSLRQRRNRFSLSSSSLARFFIGEVASLESEDDDDDDVAAEVGLAVVMIRGDVNERAG